MDAIHHGLREDGRELLDYRHCSLAVGVLPHASGSCRLRTVGTELLVGVVATLSTPTAHLPTMGRIVVSVGCGPGETASAGLPDYGMLAHGMDADSKRLWLEEALNLVRQMKYCRLEFRSPGFGF